MATTAHEVIYIGECDIAVDLLEVMLEFPGAFRHNPLRRPPVAPFPRL